MPKTRKPYTNLTPDQVIDIRVSLSSVNDLCAKYNVDIQTIMRIKSGKTWRKLTIENKETWRNPLKGSGHRLAKLTEDDVRAIRASDKTIKELAADYNVSMATIQYARSKRGWKHVT